MRFVVNNVDYLNNCVFFIFKVYLFFIYFNYKFIKIGVVVRYGYDIEVVGNLVDGE